MFKKKVENFLSLNETVCVLHGSQWDSILFVSLSNVLPSEFLVLILCYRIRA